MLGGGIMGGGGEGGGKDAAVDAGAGASAGAGAGEGEEEDDVAMMLQDAAEEAAAAAEEGPAGPAAGPTAAGLRPTALRDLDLGRSGGGRQHRLVLALIVANTVLLMYSHVGTSGLIVSNIGAVAAQGRRDLRPSSSRGLVAAATAACGPEDTARWETQTLAETLESVKGCMSCLGNATCMTSCVAREGGFAASCAVCFADVVDCGVQHCLLQCAADPANPKCTDCIETQCAASFKSCSGLTLDKSKLENLSGGPAGASSTTATPSGKPPSTEPPAIEPPTVPPSDTSPPTSAAAVGADGAASKDSGDLCEAFRPVYKVQFLDAVSKAWNNDAKLLAIVLALASGIWPYVKNALLVVAWARPMQSRTRGLLLKWLGRLGKWSFVDVFVMLLFNATLRIEKRFSEHLVLVVFATPQAGVYAFCAAATLALMQSEWMRLRHEALCGTEALSAFGPSGGGGRLGSPSIEMTNRGADGRLRSGWRTATARDRVRSQFMHERASLYLRLLMPMVGVISLLVGFYATTLLRYELKGSLSFLPGQNKFAYTGAEVARSIFDTTACEAGAASAQNAGRLVLFALFLVGVLGFPIISYIAVSLLWVIRAGVPCRLRVIKQALLNGVHRLMGLVELSADFACLDVFLVSLIVVASEVGNVVHAVGATVQTSAISMSLEVSLGAGTFYLVAAAVVLLVLQVLATHDAAALRSTLALTTGKSEASVYDQLDVEDSDEETSFMNYT